MPAGRYWRVAALLMFVALVPAAPEATPPDRDQP